MELPHLIEALSDPAAYPHPAAPIEVRQTHISAVFLAGPFAYKVKKPVDLGFLDFSTLEKRRHSCEEEVRLNRRLAPHVYLGVVPVTRDGQRIRVGGDGEVVEYAVQMARLPDDATLEARLRRGDLSADFLEALARELARFHADADGGDNVAAFGHFEVVVANARENLAQAASQAGATAAAAVFDRLAALTESHLQRLRPLIEARAKRGVPRDTHGDLRLDHIYWLPDRPEQENLAVIDCIEFNERFRYADPVADVAFLVMDLAYHGRRDLAAAFANAYFRAADDDEGRALLPFYTAYRAAVRGKVEGMKAAEAEVAPADRNAARTSAAAHWLLALGELEEPGRRPCFVLVGGLPGVGKSALALALAERADFQVIRSDVVRKELSAGHEAIDRYTAKWHDRTYAECLRRAELALSEGRRVLIDATFREERMRRAFLDAAAHWAVPALFFECRADPAAVQARLAGRRGDASDADWAVYLRAAERWEEPGPSTRGAIRAVSTGGGRDQALAAALLALHQDGLD